MPATNADFPSLTALLPHAAPSILLDSVIAADAESLHARLQIGPHTPWRQTRGVPAHVAIEYMAQACAAFDGLQGWRAGGRPAIGLLLGTRDFSARRSWFADGERLDVIAELVFRDSQLGVFACRVESAGEVCATAQLTVARPDDFAAVLARGSGDVSA